MNEIYSRRAAVPFHSLLAVVRQSKIRSVRRKKMFDKYDDTRLREEFKTLLNIRDSSFVSRLDLEDNKINKAFAEISNIHKQLKKIFERDERNFKNGEYFYELKLPEEKFYVQFETKETFIEYFAKEIYKKKAFKANKKAWRAINDYIQNFKSKK